MRHPGLPACKPFHIIKIHPDASAPGGFYFIVPSGLVRPEGGPHSQTESHGRGSPSSVPLGSTPAGSPCGDSVGPLGRAAPPYPGRRPPSSPARIPDRRGPEGVRPASHLPGQRLPWPAPVRAWPPSFAMGSAGSHTEATGRKNRSQSILLAADLVCDEL